MRSLKDRGISISAIIIEIATIIFSILLALGVNEWRETQSNKRLAFRALSDFRKELVMNRDAVGAAMKDQEGTVAFLEGVMRRYTAGEQVEVRFPEIDLPDVLTTAWETALVSRALSYIDYDILMVLSEINLQQRWLLSLEEKVFQSILSPGSHDRGQMRGLVRSIHASLKNIMQVERKLIGLYDSGIEKIDHAKPAPGRE